MQLDTHPIRVPTAFIAALLTGTAVAQGTDRHPVTESYAAGSPELAGPTDPGDVVVVNTDIASGGGRQWTAAELGLGLNHELDAFSDGTDFFPSTGPAITPPADCRVVVVEHTVDPNATGKAGGVVAAETVPGGDGAASDTFSFTFKGSTVPTAELASDHLEITPAPGPQTDIDALGWAEEEFFPAYFSVDAPTAAALGVSAADVLVALGPGAWEVAWTAAELGLAPGDNIDALAINTSGDPPPGSPNGIVVFSLAPGSPSLTGGGDAQAMGPGGLLVAKAAGPERWATPDQLDLAVAGPGVMADNLNGVRISDPLRLDWVDGDELDLDGTPWDTLRINGSDGGFPRQIHVRPHQPFHLTVTPRNPGLDFCSVWIAVGKPCEAHGLPLPGLAGPFAIFGLGAVPLVDTVFPLPFLNVQLPNPADYSLHGVSIDLLTFQLARLNLITLRVR